VTALTRFSADQVGHDVVRNRYKYRITDIRMPERIFYVTIDAGQQRRKGVIQNIESWCALNSRRLPADGETIQIDLDEVRIS
jgi:hypothetical protein